MRTSNAKTFTGEIKRAGNSVPSNSGIFSDGTSGQKKDKVPTSVAKAASKSADMSALKYACTVPEKKTVGG